MAQADHVQGVVGVLRTMREVGSRCAVANPMQCTQDGRAYKQMRREDGRPAGDRETRRAFRAMHFRQLLRRGWDRHSRVGAVEWRAPQADPPMRALKQQMRAARAALLEQPPQQHAGGGPAGSDPAPAAADPAEDGARRDEEQGSATATSVHHALHALLVHADAAGARSPLLHVPHHLFTGCRDLH